MLCGQLGQIVGPLLLSLPRLGLSRRHLLRRVSLHMGQRQLCLARPPVALPLAYCMAQHAHDGRVEHDDQDVRPVAGDQVAHGKLIANWQCIGAVMAETIPTTSPRSFKIPAPESPLQIWAPITMASASTRAT